MIANAGCDNLTVTTLKTHGAQSSRFIGFRVYSDPALINMNLCRWRVTMNDNLVKVVGTVEERAPYPQQVYRILVFQRFTRARACM